MKHPNASKRKRGAAVGSTAVFAIVVSLKCVAWDIRLAWDASPTPGITNYVLYAGTNALTAANLPTAPVRLSVGTNLTATVTNITGRWYFVATAEKDGLESEPSNMAEWPAETAMRIGTIRAGTLRSGTLRIGP